MIWFEYGEDGQKLHPIKVLFLPREDSVKEEWVKKRTPIQFQLIGSNDSPCTTTSEWDVICEKSSPIPTSTEDERQCEVDPTRRTNRTNGTKSFRCVGIRVLKVGGEAEPKNTLTCIRGIQLWVLANWCDDCTTVRP